jgi:hypothetical protein
MKNKINNKWECFLCGKEDSFEIAPYGYLSNSHPLCIACADEVLKNENHKHRFRLTYHKTIGDIIIASNIPIYEQYSNKN